MGVRQLVAYRDLVVSTTVVTVIVLAILGVGWVLIQITELLLLLLISVILAAGLAPVVARVESLRVTRRKFRLARPLAVAAIYAAAFILFTVFGGILIAPLAGEARGFAAAMPTYYARIRELVIQLQAQYPWLPNLTQIIDRLPRELGQLRPYFEQAAGVAYRFLGGVLSVITVLTFTYYMLIEGENLKRGFLILFPRGSRAQVEDLLRRVGEKFGGWLRGQLLLVLIIFVADTIGLLALGVPYAVLLGVVAGITEMIPVIGPILGAVPGVLVALFLPTRTLVLVILLYTLVQQIEGNILVPKVMRSTVGLSPILTIAALIIGATLMGIVGALLAIPVAAGVQVVVSEVVRTLRPDEM